jgi:PAS domain S-box-containing protein
VRKREEGANAGLRQVGGTTDRVGGERAARAAAHEAQEFFRCSFEQAPIGMSIIGLDGRYARVNDAFGALVGYSQKQLTGQSRERITHPDDLAGDELARSVLLAGDATSDRREKRYVHALGHVIWAAVSVTLIRDADGLPLYFISQVQDVSERRSYERQLAYVADHDLLTSLPNRRSLERELGRQAARVRRYGAAGAC